MPAIVVSGSVICGATAIERERRGIEAVVVRIAFAVRISFCRKRFVRWKRIRLKRFPTRRKSSRQVKLGTDRLRLQLSSHGQLIDRKRWSSWPLVWELAVVRVEVTMLDCYFSAGT